MCPSQMTRPSAAMAAAKVRPFMTLEAVAALAATVETVAPVGAAVVAELAAMAATRSIITDTRLPVTASFRALLPGVRAPGPREAPQVGAVARLPRTVAAPLAAAVSAVEL